MWWRHTVANKRFTSRPYTRLYYLKTDGGHIILSLMLLAEGCDISVLVRCSKRCEATIACWLERAGKHSSLFHNSIFRELVLTFVQIDELYCRVHRTGKMWL
jgi:hypothetical protein